jgi:hypothetical protein
LIQSSDIVGLTVGLLVFPVHHPSDSRQLTSDPPQQNSAAPSATQAPLPDLQQPAPLDLQHEYRMVRNHVLSQKDISSGLPAIASIAALRSCMTDLKNAATMYSAAWFEMVRETINEELVGGGFVGLPSVVL